MKTYITNKLLEFNQVIKIFLVLLILLCNLKGLNAQTTVYSEDFSNDDGIGWEGSYTGPTDNNWSLVKVGSPDVSGGDYCKVVSGQLEWKDLNANSSNRVDFYSSSIAGAYSSVSISLDYSVAGAGYTASLTAYYNIDGGSWVQFGNASTTSYSASTGSFSQSGLSFSSSIQVKVEGYNGNSSSAKCKIDDISVTGVLARSPLTFYVNDYHTTGDTWCTAIGNNANDGLSPSSPKYSLGAALALATTSGDVIRVDKGTYAEENLSIPDGSGTINY